MPLRKRKKSKPKYDFDQLSPVEVYQLVLTGRIEKFPAGSWRQPDSIEYAVEIVRFFIEKILNWSDDDIKKRLSQKTFYEYKLRGLLTITFRGSPFLVINAAYPGRFKEWELPMTRVKFWTPENGIKAVKWLIEEKLQWSDDDLKKKISVKVFADYGLRGVVYKIFHSSPFQAINAAYPGRFKEWELPAVPMGFWTLENAIMTTKWLIEEKLQWSDEDIKKKISKRIFYNYGLRCGIGIFNNSPFQALNAAYPGRFKEWELPRVPINFWTLENGIKVVKWLIEEKLKWSDEDIKAKISTQTFYNHRLGSALQTVFNNSLFQALNAAYPGRFDRDYFHKRTKRILTR